MALKVSIRQDKPEKVEPSITLYLELAHDSDIGDFVDLMGMDADGNEWVIAQLRPKGILIANGIDPDTGWPIDASGRMKVIKDT